MATYTVADCSHLLGVSQDTVRRWIDSGRLEALSGRGGRLAVGGAALAAFATTLAPRRPAPPITSASARNRLTGLVTRVVRDGVMAQVEMQAGPYRLVSLMSREAADELGLEAGVLAVASVKATHVVVEVPAPPSRGRRS